MYLRTTGCGLAALLFCLGARAGLAAEPGSFSLGLGAHYSSGDYGTGVDTRIFALPVTGQYDAGPLSLKLTIPWLRVSGGTAIPGVGQVPNTNPRGRGTAGADNTASGLGDLVAAATYTTYYDRASGTGVDVTGKIKFGTADADKGLGTGENDYTAQVDAYKIYDRSTVFGGVGYTIFGSSSFISLDDAISVNVGGSYRVADRDTLGLRFDARDPVYASVAEQREVMAYWIRRIDRTWKAQTYLLKGYADGSPDWGVGATMAYAF